MEIGVDGSFTSGQGFPTKIKFVTIAPGGNGNIRMTIKGNGNVGIGVTNPTQNLEVVGNVKAMAFISNTTTYPDYVFEKGYSLMPLAELEGFIAREGHLPKIASADDVKESGGVNISQLQLQLLEKIEELTLHTLAQQRLIEAQQQQTKTLKAELQQLKKSLN